MKTKKMLLTILTVFIILVLLAVAGGWMMFGSFIRAANTIEQVEDGLYVMEVKGDYGLDKFIEQGGCSSDAELADFLTGYLSHGFYKSNTDTSSAYGCSALTIRNSDGGVLYGRNFDWDYSPTMIVHTKPDNGYQSMSTCCLSFLGFGEDYKPDGSIGERIMSIASVYVPLDGMNEKGLVVADLVAGDKEETHQDTERPDFTTTSAIRLLLDRAANVEEAIELLSSYDMNTSIGRAHHYYIADKSGRSVVVEYIGGEMIVTDTNAVTNFYLSEGEKYGIGSEQSHLRYDKLMSYKKAEDMEAVRDMLKSVAQFNYPDSDGSYGLTLWSIVYNPEALTADFYFNEDYSNSYGLILMEPGSFLKMKNE